MTNNLNINQTCVVGFRIAWQLKISEFSDAYQKNLYWPSCVVQRLLWLEVRSRELLDDVWHRKNPYVDLLGLARTSFGSSLPLVLLDQFLCPRVCYWAPSAHGKNERPQILEDSSSAACFTAWQSRSRCGFFFKNGLSQSAWYFIHQSNRYESHIHSSASKHFGWIGNLDGAIRSHFGNAVAK